MHSVEQTELFTHLLIKADRILENGMTIQEELPSDWLSLLLEEPKNDFAWKAVRPSHIELQLKPEGELIHLTGNGIFWLTSCCVRCMKDVPFGFKLHFNLRLFPREKANQDTFVEMELLGEDDATCLLDENDGDLTTVYYNNQLINISLLLKEQLFLELPTYPACGHELALNKDLICELKITKAVVSENSLRKNPFASLAQWFDRLAENEKI